MTYHMRAALCLAAAVMFLDMALAQVASAQDVMQLDLMFRDSLLRKAPLQSEADHHGRREDVGAAHQPIDEARRPPRPRRHKKT